MFDEIASLIPAEFYSFDLLASWTWQGDCTIALSLLVTYLVLRPFGIRGSHKVKTTKFETTGKIAAFDLPESKLATVITSHDRGENVGRVFLGLAKTRSYFAGKVLRIWSGKGLDSHEFWTELEDGLIAADMGVQTSGKLIARLREQTSDGELPTKSRAAEILNSEIVAMLGADVPPIQYEIKAVRPYVIMVVGVNGSGKTTTIGKLAKQLTDSGLTVMLAACDTFRAAAREQLEEWANRSGAMLECGADSEKPATVVYRALEKVRAGGVDVLIVDTAGRLHTRVNLMHELESVVRLVSRDLPGAPHQTLLVLDGTSGQNALHQAREFKSKAGVTGIIITKLDGTPKGGIVVGIRDELAIPIRYIGVGERVDDLQPFRAAEFAGALLEGFADNEHDAQLEVNGRGASR